MLLKLKQNTETTEIPIADIYKSFLFERSIEPSPTSSYKPAFLFIKVLFPILYSYRTTPLFIR